jgi:hypothetical protein
MVTNETYFCRDDLGRDDLGSGTETVDPSELNLFVSFGRQVAAGMVKITHAHKINFKIHAFLHLHFYSCRNSCPTTKSSTVTLQPEIFW